MINDTVNEIPKDNNDELPIKRGRGRPPREGEPQPKPKPIKEEKHSLYLDDPKAYFRKYYKEKTNKDIICRTCNHCFTCNSSMTRHLKENRNCKIMRLQIQINAIVCSS